MSFISFVVKRGKLSEIDIDIDKVWRDMLANPRGISHIKQVADLMTTGSLAEHDGTMLVPFYPSLDGYVCTSQGPGKMLTWAPPGGTLKYYFPVSIALAHALAKPAVNRTFSKNAPITSENKEAYLDDVPDMIKRLTPAIASALAGSVVPVDRSYSHNVPVGTDLSILVDGFVEETAGGVQTDHTAEARSAAANDLNLCPMTPLALDKIYIGSNFKFWRVWINYGQAGVGNWANAGYYWNGAWTATIDEDDQTSDFTAAADIRRYQHTPQADWALSVIMGMNLYWLMIRTDAFINQTVKPLGSQIFVSIK